jgi:hypothetical protein
MLVRFAVVLAGLLAAWPAVAGEMNSEEARRFVAGKLFSFRCFEGSAGAGRVFHDGSVAGIIRFGGAGPIRYVALPAGTLRVRGDAWCASLKGVSFQPCFDLVKTDDHSFRGSVTGFGFAFCTFTRRNARSEMVRATALPPSLGSAATAQKGE